MGKRIFIIPISSAIILVAIIVEVTSLFYPWAVSSCMNKIYPVYLVARYSLLLPALVYLIAVDVLYLALTITNLYYRVSTYILKTSIFLDIVITVSFLSSLIGTPAEPSIGFLVFIVSSSIKILSLILHNVGVLLIEIPSLVGKC